MLLALFIRTFVVQAFKIPSGSMIPTLFVGDHILVNKFIYGTRIPFTNLRFLTLRDPRRTDIIVFRYPEDETKDFIKRVVGEPGDIVQVKSKHVFVNGTELTEPYAVHSDDNPLGRDIQNRDNFGPVTVPAGSFFVMGDNRDQSLDSRFWGFVTEDKIKGKAFLIYWSWDGKNTWVRWNRLAHLIR